jgi:hypothetical protein
MRTVSQIIDDLGGARFVATSLGLPIGTVAAWKHRESIPADKWLAVIGLNPADGKDGASAHELAAAHAEPAPATQSESVS